MMANVLSGSCTSS